MDRYDREILMLLQTEGRISFTTLAERIALSPSATLRRVQALEVAGVITGYRAMLDAHKLGHEVRAFVEVNVDRANPMLVEQFLNIGRMLGQADQGPGRDARERFDDLLEEWAAVQKSAAALP